MGSPVVLASSADRPAWLEARRSLVGASEVACLLGLDPHDSPFALYQRKVGLLADDDSATSEAAEWGLRLEPAIASAFEARTGRATRLAGTLLRSPDLPCLGATLDAEWWERAGPPAPTFPLELKTVGLRLADDWADGPPRYYVPQLQAQLLVTGAPRGSFACLIGGQRLVWADVEADPDMQDRIAVETAAFWRRVEDRDPPPVDGSDATRAMLARLHPEQTPGAVVELPPEAVGWTAEIDALGVEIKDREREADRLRNLIRERIGDAERGILVGGGAWTWKKQTRAAYTVAASESRVLRHSKGGR